MSEERPPVRGPCFCSACSYRFNDVSEGSLPPAYRRQNHHLTTVRNRRVESADVPAVLLIDEDVHVLAKRTLLCHNTIHYAGIPNGERRKCVTN